MGSAKKKTTAKKKKAVAKKKAPAKKVIPVKGTGYWLFKTEPDAYSIDDLAAQPKATDHWDGIRNYQVRNFIRDEMKKGDQVLLYHSNSKPSGVVGLAKVVKEAYPDHTAEDPQSKYYDPKVEKLGNRWLMVDIKLVKKFKKLISLDDLRQERSLKDMLLLRRGMRLSVMPVSKKEFDRIVEVSQS